MLRLKVELEQNRVAVVVEDCRAELDREMKVLSDTCTSEQVIHEHRVRFRIPSNVLIHYHYSKLEFSKVNIYSVSCQTYFRAHAPHVLCEKGIRNMEELCLQLPDNDPAHHTLNSTRRAVAEVSEQIRSVHFKLKQHPDKWEEWNER